MSDSSWKAHGLGCALGAGLAIFANLLAPEPGLARAFAAGLGFLIGLAIPHGITYVVKPRSAPRHRKDGKAH